MMKTKMQMVLVLMLSMSAASLATTIAYWDFEDGVAGQPFTPAGQPEGSGGTYDTVNHYMMRGWNDY